MKRYGNLYEKIIAWDNLLEAARKARRGKRMRPNVAEYERDLEGNLVELQARLERKTYRSPGRIRTIPQDVKSRRIVKKVEISAKKQRKQKKIDRGGIKTALEYQKMLERPDINSRADLAKLLGVSRARVTQVLKRLE